MPHPTVQRPTVQRQTVSHSAPCAPSAPLSLLLARRLLLVQVEQKSNETQKRFGSIPGAGTSEAARNGKEAREEQLDLGQEEANS